LSDGWLKQVSTATDGQLYVKAVHGPSMTEVPSDGNRRSILRGVVQLEGSLATQAVSPATPPFFPCSCLCLRVNAAPRRVKGLLFVRAVTMG